MKKNITLNKNKILRRIKDNKKYTRRRKFYMRRGGNDDIDIRQPAEEYIPAQEIGSPARDVSNVPDIDEPLETSLPVLPTLDVEEQEDGMPQPLPLEEQEAMLQLPPLEEQEDITQSPPLEEQEDITQSPPTDNNPSLNKKFVLVRISLPDGNIMDLQGNTSTTIENTVQELKNEGRSTSSSEQNTRELSLRLNDLEKMIDGLNNKLDTLIKNTNEPATLPEPTQPEDIMTKTPETTDYDFLAFPPISTPPQTSQEDELPPVSSEEQPDLVTDDLTAFGEVDD
jgi:hypothetical protein